MRGRLGVPVVADCSLVDDAGRLGADPLAVCGSWLTAGLSLICAVRRQVGLPSFL
ncbi:hypothetical protein D3C86_1378690 [compost metagenome]